jgi:hypothetical protein
LLLNNLFLLESVHRPRSDFTDLGNRQKGEEVGLYGKFGIAPIKNTGFFIFGMGGFTRGEEIQLTQSNGRYRKSWVRLVI